MRGILLAKGGRKAFLGKEDQTHNSLKVFPLFRLKPGFWSRDFRMIRNLLPYFFRGYQHPLENRVHNLYISYSVLFLSKLW